MTIHELARRAKKINLTDIGREIIIDHKNDIVDKNRNQLVNEGVNKLGGRLKQYRSLAYAKYKNRLNPVVGFGYADFYLHGTYQESLKLNILNKNTFEIKPPSSDKATFLLKRDPEHLGLTDESKQEISKEFMQAELVQGVKKILFG